MFISKVTFPQLLSIQKQKIPPHRPNFPFPPTINPKATGVLVIQSTQRWRPRQPSYLLEVRNAFNIWLIEIHEYRSGHR